MIPILYEKDETSFVSNGLGRLRDCISCFVTEERNGIYECDFEYPVSGSHFEDIQLGRIIGVEHDISGDVQPFDIIGHERSIDGKVRFHAVHLSYRQSKLVAIGTGISTIDDAFERLWLAMPFTNPFRYQTDMISERYIAAFDGTPRSVRSLLGGVEGSILDAYGGEYEWDKWNVILHSARGTERDLTIRYGVNLLSYDEDTSYSESYSAVIPFWKNDETIVVGSMIDSGAATYSGRTECISLDLSDKFEDPPSVSALEQMAQNLLQTNQPHLPAQTIKVDFIRLQDTPEYAHLAALYECKLCDTVKVVFPRYGMEGRFKIVKTVYDVLQDRYTTMELGTLSTSLAEALGISPSLDGVQAKEYDDFVVVRGTLSQATGEWNWVKWDSGRYELSCYIHDIALNSYATQGGFYGYQYTIGWHNTFPDFINTDYSVVHHMQVAQGFSMPAAQLSKTESAITLYALASVGGAQTVSLSCQMVGRWK